MIARPRISRNEWNTAEIGAFEVGNFALFSCPVRREVHLHREARRVDERGVRRDAEPRVAAEAPRGLDGLVGQEEHGRRGLAVFLEFAEDAPQLVVRGRAELVLAVRGVRRGAAEVPNCLLYTSPSPRDRQKSRMPSSA